MTSHAPTLAAPLSTRGGADAARGEGAPRAAPPPPRRRRSIFPWALGGSALLHLLFLALSPLFLRVGPPPGEVEDAHALARPAMRALEIAPAESGAPAAAAAAAAPTPTAERVRIPVPGPPAPQLTEEEGRAAPATEPAAPSLRAGLRDPRLWVAPRDVPAPPEPTEHERYMSHLRARLDAVNDSMGMGTPNADWTTTDAEGRRWGLSPAGIHLGGVTIPRELLPLPRGSSEQEYADIERRRMREEIQRDEDARERQRVRDERERVPRRGDGGG